MGQMGSAPFLGGGFGHFYAYAPFKQEYPINRYAMEVKRQLDVLDRRLADNEYVAGADYTVADMAIWTRTAERRVGQEGVVSVALGGRRNLTNKKRTSTTQ